MSIVLVLLLEHSDWFLQLSETAVFRTLRSLVGRKWARRHLKRRIFHLLVSSRSSSSIKSYFLFQTLYNIKQGTELPQGDAAELKPAAQNHFVKLNF
eukprot:g75444.t1